MIIPGLFFVAKATTTASSFNLGKVFSVGIPSLSHPRAA